MTDYVRLCRGLADKGQLIPIHNGDLTDIYNKLHLDKDAYVSVYYFNENHNVGFQKTGTVSGITDVVGDKLVWDFDCEDNIQLAQDDARQLVSNLKKIGFNDKAIRIFFSGKKGFEVSINITERLTPTQVKNICLNFADGLNTVDTKIYNATRILRLPLTKHQLSGLYKFPLSVEDLMVATIDEIKDLAKTTLSYLDIKHAWTKSSLPIELDSLKTITPNVPLNVKYKEIGTLDLSTLNRDTPPGYDIVRWALLQGYFTDGERNNALLYLAAFLKSLNYAIEHTYRILKGTCEIQAERTNAAQRYPDSELYNNIVTVVYSDNWQGGTGSPKDVDSWLYHYAKSTGLYEELDETTRRDILTVEQVGSLFRTFAANIDKNRLEFGIEALDKELDALVGRSYIIGGSPGSGKTSLALQIMNNTSLKNTRSIFFSFDMSVEDVFQKLIQKHFKLNAKDVYDQAKDPERLKEFMVCVAENYKNTHFIRSSGMTTEAMRKRIHEIERACGEVKMVIVDYLDLVQSEFSDPTQKSMAIMQGLKSIGTDMRKCMIILAQPNKANQKINQPVASYSAIKGSGALGELANAVLWIHRPGASARGFENDKYYTIDCLKNRHGAMFNLDFSWEGVSGTINTLTAEQKIRLSDLRDQLNEQGDHDI